jgi:EAL domain-containing protein (putative c-di-GMP-specific phosphodiesterase class I)
MVRSIISLVQYLEMECVAEGVETQEQRDLIAMIDCDYWQGNLFSKAVPATEIEELLGSGATRVAPRTME